jgi:phosphopantetheinyl transferase
MDCAPEPRLEPRRAGPRGAVRLERDRAVFVAAHALLRYALRAVLGGVELRLRTNDYGKPELDLAIEHAVHFNLSDTHGIAVCAICSGHAVGVDVEAIDRKVDVMTLAARLFRGPGTRAHRESLAITSRRCEKSGRRRQTASGLR